MAKKIELVLGKNNIVYVDGDCLVYTSYGWRIASRNMKTDETILSPINFTGSGRSIDFGKDRHYSMTTFKFLLNFLNIDKITFGNLYGNIGKEDVDTVKEENS